MIPRSIQYCLAWLSILFAPVQTMASTTLEKQRELFPKAKLALLHDQTDAFRKLKAKLQGYPLYPYLDIWEARRALKYHHNDRPARRVLQQYANIPESRDLRLAWIKYLTKHKQWDEIAIQMQRHTDIAHALPQTAMVARWHTEPTAQMLSSFTRYWTSGGTIIETMHPFEREWHKAAHPSHDELWTRIQNVFKQGHWKEASKLAQQLPKTERNWLQQWKNIANHPATTLAAWSPDSIHDSTIARIIGEDGLYRLARKDPAVARQQLSRLASLFPLQQLHAMQRSFALRAAKRHQPEALQWLGTLPPEAQTDETREWQVRLALIEKDWPLVRKLITNMPARQAAEARWVYWHAQALKQKGKDKTARKLLASIAHERGYYSFLSARELGQPYQLHASVLPLQKTVIQALEDHPAMIRAHEWWLLHESSKAAREWMLALNHGQRQQWQAAAFIAKTWGWHTMAIRAVAKAGQLDALDYRFPLAFETHIQQAEKLTKLDDITIWSIIRQESAFNDRAVSRTGAKGLMQLMPATARQVAHQLRLRKTFDLFDPGTNIRLGSTYLSDMYQRFGKIEYAAAAYNAGPGRVKQWLANNPVADTRIWVESIPFNETRRYVQQVMAFRIVYDWRKKQQQSMDKATLQKNTSPQVVAERESLPTL